mgnify:CR=1 FL=1
MRTGSKGRVYLDVLFEKHGLVVEIDGAEHELDLRFDGPVQITLNGVDNQLNWSGDEPAISSSGVGHRIVRQ